MITLCGALLNGRDSPLLILISFSWRGLWALFSVRGMADVRPHSLQAQSPPNQRLFPFSLSFALFPSCGDMRHGRKKTPERNQLLYCTCRDRRLRSSAGSHLVSGSAELLASQGLGEGENQSISGRLLQNKHFLGRLNGGSICRFTPLDPHHLCAHTHTLNLLYLLSHSSSQHYAFSC